MPQPETITVQTTQLSCDGGNDDLGHPRVYLTLTDGAVDCPYCGRHFVLAAGAKQAAH